MSKKLMAFYSRADENYFGGIYKYISVGNTEKVAKVIAAFIGADIFKIEQKNPYSKEYKKCIAEAKKDLQNKIYPEVLNLPDNLDEYDEIYLGYPNYWGTMPMAVYTFLRNYDFTEKTIHPFCSHEGSGISGTERDIQREVKGATVAKGLAVFGSSVDNAKQQIENWCK